MYFNLKMQMDVYGAYRNALDNESDQRTRGWIFMDSPLPTFFITLAYIYFAKVFSLINNDETFNSKKIIFKIAGPRLMRNRKPFNIERLQLIYNTIHLLINLYLFNEGGQCGWFNSFSYRCQSVDSSNHENSLRVCKNE